MSSKALEKAIKQNDEQRVRKLLGAKGNVATKVLIHALQSLRNDPVGHRIVQLLSNHVELTFCDSDLVITTLVKSHPAAARQLVERGAPFPALHRAALFGDNDAVALVLQEGTDANDTDRSVYGSTAVHVAACCGSTDTVKVLHSSGADVNAKNNYGATPMHLASRHGHTDTANWLCDSGADVNAKDNYGEAPMHKAAWNGHTGTAEWLRDNGADVNAKDNYGEAPMHKAAWNGHTGTAEWLRDNGADVNAKDHFGAAPMHKAAWNGHTGTAEWLRDNGADVNAKDNYGEAPMHKAAENGHTGTAEWLRDNGADVNAKVEFGGTPMHKAAENGHTDTVKLLRDSGADVNAKVERGTPMHKAAENGHTDTVKLLRDSGADVNAKAEFEQTPMHKAAENGHTDTAKLLRDIGADVNARDEFEETPMHKAAQDGHTDTVRFLKCSGADVTAQNENNKTPFDVARDRKHVDVVRVLETDRAELLFEEWTAVSRELQAKGRAMSASSETALVEVLGDASAEMDGPNGWAAPPEPDAVAAAIRRIDELRAAREKLSTLVAAPDRHGRFIPPEEVAQCRADCCTAAQALLDLLPPMTAATGADAEAICVRGIAGALRRPSPELVRELTAAVAAATQAHKRGAEDVARAAVGAQRPLAAALQAALRANDECGEHAEVLQKKLHEARRALAVAAPAADLTAEECGQHRAAAEAVLAEEGPWAGAAGLERRAAALVSVAEAITSRKQAQRTVKVAARAVAKAELDVHSSDDESAAKEAEATLHKARAMHDAALPALLSATAAAQEWVTSGEGALALQAFPCDAELSAACAALFQAEFTADTVLPRAPDTELGDAYSGLTKTAAACVFYARRRGGAPGGAAVVLRRLRLDTAALVEDARRQLRDAGRIAVGLRACPDAAAGCPPIVKATRWFVAKGPEGGAADAWLEFPRAEFGSLAEAAERGVRLSAVASRELCLRLVRAVAQLHAAGIRHGDLNPNNVVLWDDAASDLVRPGIIDLLDTVVVGATQTLRGATLEWLPPEATKALAKGATAYATRELDCWQLGRMCLRVLDASAVPSDAVRAAAARLCVTDPKARSSAAVAMRAMEAAMAGATAAAAVAAAASEWALPPGLWHCRRGAARGVDFVELDPATDAAARALTACATAVGRAVRAVYRLENVQLWRVYVAELARVAKQARGAAWPQRLADEAAATFAPHGAAALSQEPPGGPGTGEALLLHGAAASHRLIAEGGFDPSYSGDRVGALFGAATCLTPLWAKAANEYARGAGAGVFVTRAAVGRVADCLATPLRETSRYRRPPDGHHSVLGDNGTPGAVVAMYRPSQMYPEYLVVFDS